MHDQVIATLPHTIADLPFFASGRYPKTDLLGRCTGTDIVTTSGRELVERVRDLSLGLSTLGMRRGDRVAIVAESRPEWLLADFAILTAGAVTVPIYPTLSVEQVAYILRDSGVRLVIASNASQVAKLQAAAATLAELTTIVHIDEVPPGAPVAQIALDEVAALGHRQI